MPRNALGRGLSALIREPENDSLQTQPPPLQQPEQVSYPAQQTQCPRASAVEPVRNDGDGNGGSGSSGTD